MSGLDAAAQIALAAALIVLGVQYVRVFILKKTPARPARSGSWTVPGRPTGIYATDPDKRIEAFRELEQAAQKDPKRRQEFVDLVLAQMRFRMWSQDPGWQDRLWALVVPHLRPGHRGFWPGIDLRVERGILAGVDLSGCEIRFLAFDRVRLEGTARFVRTVFTGDVTFEGSCFARHARFRGVEFRGDAGFDHVTFTGTASFPGVTVAGTAGFHHARFSGLTDFTSARFAGPVTYKGAGFAGRTWFRDTHFAARTRFAEARFTGHVDFAGASFADQPGLAQAFARTDWYAVRTWPEGWTLDAHDGELPKHPGRWAELKQ